MQYLTLHELARQFNKPERQVRYRFRELLKAGKLTEGEDFRKEDFVDELHFAYKINPLRFMAEAKLVLDQQAVTNIVSKTDEIGSQSASKEDGFDTNENVHHEPIGTQEHAAGYQSGSQEPGPVSKPGNHSPDSATQSGTNQESFADKTVLLDYIDTMKEQLHVKDSQIESYKQQLDDQSGVTRAAITELLKMKDQVLRLRGTRGEEEEQQQAWSAQREHSADDEPHHREEGARADGQSNE
jgi:hypothetical protein